jgi:hypothetical protein
MVDSGRVGPAADRAGDGFDQSELLARLRGCPTEELKFAFGQLDALENAVRVQRLHVLAVLDERDAHGVDGALDMEGWVAAQSLVTRRHALRQVATARNLKDLPKVATVAARGELSWDQLVPVAQIADTESDERWAREGRGFSPAQLVSRARGKRRARNEDDLDKQRQRSLVWWFDQRIKMLRLKGRLTLEQGERLVRALERIVERDPTGPDGTPESWEARYADALAELAGVNLAQDSDSDRACVVVHLDHDTATGFVGERDEPLHRRCAAGWGVMRGCRCCSATRSATRSGSAPGSARCHPRSGVSCGGGIGRAGSRAVIAPGVCRPITWSIGNTVGRPKPPTC